MNAHAVASAGDAWDIRSSRPVELICFGLCVATAVYLLASLVLGHWLFDSDGRVIPTDFVNVWAAGRLVLEGRPEAAYDQAIHKAVEDASIGYAFEGYYGWLYPLPAYVAAIRVIVGQRIGILLACAFPAVLANFVVGQNGFFSAALLGGALGCMQRRPVLAGCFLGLLTYKPHLGVLFPLVLIAGGRWRVFFAAAAVAILVSAMSWAAFGTSTWTAFVHSLPIGSQAILAEGQGDWHKLQSLFGIVRSLGGSEALAWWLQSGVIGVIAILLCALWRSRAAFDLKAAALATGALLATPYLYMYDYVTLAVPMAFLVHAGLTAGFRRGDVIGFAATSLLILIFPLLKAPIGPLAILIIAVLIGRRIFYELRSSTVVEQSLRLSPS